MFRKNASSARLLFLCLLLLCTEARFVFSLDEDETDVSSPRGTDETIKHGLIGGAEILLSHAFLTSFNKLVIDFPMALPTSGSVRRSFTDPWIWEDEAGFMVNQIGHPVQGSVSFNAGRVNGFNFYTSAFFSAFGSLTWETFGEGTPSSINDFIVTTFGSLSLGEIAYRLYLEARASGVPWPLTFLFNPIADFHRLVTGWNPPDYGKKLYRLQFRLGAGYNRTNSDIYGHGYGQEVSSFRGFYSDIGFSAVYGNPFIQESSVPFEHFEISMFFGMDFAKYIDIRVITDGYLFSFSPVYTDTDMMSTGLSLIFDFVTIGNANMDNSNLNQSAIALDWTVKYQHLFSENTVFQAKAHTGVTYMGVSGYYSPDLGIDLKNYGYGLNGKFFFTLEQKKMGKIDMSVFGYTLWTYPGTSEITRGSVYWLFTDITYSRIIYKKLSLGVTGSYAMERGIYSKDGFPNSKKSNKAVKFFVAWNV